MEAVDRSSAEHYLWGQGCDGWRLVNRADLSVIAERVPPGGKETRHFHSLARQFFFILQGQAVIEVSGTRVALCAGQGLEIPQGAPHQFINESEEPIDFLVISHPSTKGDRYECPD
jgi:mannose-6-phosphate isomerase-like protein (cupin superfamily)